MASGREPYTLTPRDKAAIRSTAGRLGIRPADLLAAMQYETIGTLNPDITGGKGGNYQGLIQFGPTERKAYGYQKGMGFAAQVEGPVYNYLKDRGLKPGMDIGRLYRTINGGNPNAKLTANDGNGTIAQHIERIKSEYLPAANQAVGLDVSPAMMAVVSRARQLLPEGVQIGMFSTGGARTKEEQAALVNAGWSQTMKSEHLDGSGIDLVPVDENGVPQPDSEALYQQINDAMMQASNELGIGVEWGGNWKGFKDQPHYQLSDKNAVLPPTYDPLSGKIIPQWVEPPTTLPFSPQAVAELTAAGYPNMATSAPTLDSSGQNPVMTARVKEQQQILQDAGLYNGPIDGIYGPDTKAALLAHASAGTASRIGDVASLVSPASLVTSYADAPATMATQAPPAPPPVMTPTPPPFALEGTATAGQGNGATATGVLPPAVPTPRSRPLGGGPVAPPPTMASTPAPFNLEGSASTGQGASASATGTLPSVVPMPRERPQQFRTGTAYLPGPKMTAAPYPYDEPPGFERLGKPNMAVSSPLAANKPVVQPLPPAPAPQPAPEPVKEPTPAGVSFISAASIPNLDASGAGSPNDSIVAAQSPIEAAVNGVGAASRLPEPPPAPVVTPAPVMEVSAPVQPPTNMATMRPPSPSIVTTQAPPSMATSPAGSWFSKLFGGASTNGGRGFTPTGGGVTPGGLAYRTGTGLGGQPGLQWTNSKGQTVTAVENSFGQPGYSVGYG